MTEKEKFVDIKQIQYLLSESIRVHSPTLKAWPFQGRWYTLGKKIDISIVSQKVKEFHPLLKLHHNVLSTLPKIWK